MPEIIFSGPDGRLEGRYVQAEAGSPIAMILHPMPQLGGTMNNPIVYRLYHHFADRGFSVLRFNFRGVGRSQGAFDEGIGELSDAAAALDWLEALTGDVSQCWVAGYSFGAWIGMQLLMRRPEISGFISVSPPANLYDFGFLAPCPTSGLITYGDQDKIVPKADVASLIGRLQEQRGIAIEGKMLRGANHFYDDKEATLDKSIKTYLNQRIPEIDEAKALGAAAK
ncbi:MAG: alpha/beta hydrolase [Alphaproteobacteria bacterium]|nr:alpha/beta hydrolase [Alphaproteobacteria bacterium]MBE8220779.1 alpha/beta hydrolase [Alphaproteobacteria bacterium]